MGQEPAAGLQMGRWKGRGKHARPGLDLAMFAKERLHLGHEVCSSHLLVAGLLLQHFTEFIVIIEGSWGR